MQTLTLTICAVLTCYLVIRVVVDYYAGRHPLISYRNLFLVGLVLFQGVSAILALGFDQQRYQGVTITTATYARYGIGLVAFTVAFLWFYRARRAGDAIARMIPTRAPSVATPVIFALLFVSISVGLASRVAQVQAAVPAALQGLFLMTGRGLVCFSIVMLVWLWHENRLNPFAWIGCSGLCLILLLSLLQGEFGRRSLLSGLLAVGWGMYMFRWQFFSAVRNTPTYAAWALAVLVVIGAVSAIRTENKDDTSVGTRLTGVTQNLNFSVVFNLLYTDTFDCSTYAIERYTHDLSPKPLDSTWYVLSSPIPRVFWPDKPESLALTLPQVVSIPELQTFSWGPGIMGHAYFEGSGLFAIYFAFIWGTLFAAFDRRVAQQSANPYFVAISGAALGQIAAMARGDIGFFMVNWIFGTLGPMALVYFFGLFSADRADVAADIQHAEDVAAVTEGEWMDEEPETWYPDAEPATEKAAGDESPVSA